MKFPRLLFLLALLWGASVQAQTAPAYTEGPIPDPSGVIVGEWTPEEIRHYLNHRESLLDSEYQRYLERMKLSAQNYKNAGNNLSVVNTANLDLPSIVQDWDFAPSRTDQGTVILKKLLGEPVDRVIDWLGGEGMPSSEEPQVTALTQMLGVLSYLALGISMILLVYGALTLGSLMLSNGNRASFFSEIKEKPGELVQVGFRMSNGFLGNIPLPSFGGLNFAQLLVLSSFIIGLGIASKLAIAVAPVFYTTPVVNASLPTDEVSNLATHMLNMQVCSIIQAKNSNDKTLANFKKAAVKGKYTRDADTSYVSMGESLDIIRVTANVPDADSCGSFYVTTTDGDSAFIPDFIESIMVDNAADTMTDELSNAYKVSVMEVAAIKLYYNLMPLALLATNDAAMRKEIVGLREGDPEYDKWVAIYWRAIDTFESDVNRIMRIAENTPLFREAGQKFKRNVTENGALLSGVYYSLMTRQQNMLASAIESSIPEIEEVDLDRVIDSPWYMEFFGLSDPSSQPYVRATSVLEVLINSARRLSPTDASSLMQLNEVTSKDSVFGLAIAKFGRSVSEAATGFSRLGEYSTRSNPDPLLEIHSMGVKLQQVALGIMAAGALLDEEDGGRLSQSSEKMKNEKKEGSNNGLIGRASDLASASASTALQVLLLISFIYSIIIPSLPLVMFFMATLGLFTLLIKGLVAAPFWFAMFNHPQGRDMIGRGGAGYPLIVSLVLSPVLLIVGLYAAMAMNRIVGYLANLTIMPGVQIMNNGFTAPSNFISLFIIYGIVVLVATYKNFGLIYELRQSVLRFMGVESAYTDFGEDRMQMAVAGLGSSAGGYLSGAAGKVQQRQQSRKQAANRLTNDGKEGKDE